MLGVEYRDVPTMAAWALHAGRLLLWFWTPTAIDWTHVNRVNAAHVGYYGSRL